VIMLDFYGSFMIFTILAVLSFAGCIIFFIVKIINVFYDRKKREENERIVQNTADSLLYYKEKKNIAVLEELVKQVNIPKHMIVKEENGEIVILYKKLSYNVNKGRFIVYT